VFRPTGSGHCVIDVDQRLDVTAQFTDATGGIDLLARAGLDIRSARRAMRFGTRELSETTERDDLVRRLARVDRDRLWAAAEDLHDSHARLEEEAGAAGSTVEDAEVIERIERNHEEFERSQLQSEQIRKTAFVVAGSLALAAVPMVRWVGPFVVAPLALLAVAAVAVSLAYWQRMNVARSREDVALAAAGAQSYLGFHLQRVNSLLSSDVGRQRLITAAEEHRDAAQRWAALAGDVDVEWALTNREEITAAARTRHEAAPAPGAGDPEQGNPVEIARAVAARLGTLRSPGGVPETFPALLDEPFAGLDPAALSVVLELLVEHSEHQQIILLTESQAIGSWARLEAMTSTIGVIEPTPTSRESTCL
jgi:hypothetical protein